MSKRKTTEKLVERTYKLTVDIEHFTLLIPRIDSKSPEKSMEDLLNQLLYLSGFAFSTYKMRSPEEKIRTIKLIHDDYLTEIMKYEKSYDEDDNEWMTPEEDVKRRLTQMNKFMSWLRKHGCDTKVFDIKPNKERTDIVVTFARGVKAGENIYQLRNNMLTISTEGNGHIFKDTKLEPFAEHTDTIDKHEIALANDILLAKYFPKNKSAQNWQPYLAILPVRYENVLYYTMEDFELLKFSPEALDEAVRLWLVTAYKYVEVKHFYMHHLDKASELARRCAGNIADKITYKRFRWAMATALNERVPVQYEVENTYDDDRANSLAVFPLLGMLKIQNPSDVLPDFVNYTRIVQLKSKTSYKSNQEPKRGYNPRYTNVFRQYGMAPTDFAEVNFHLSLGTNSNGHFWEKRKEILHYFQLRTKEIFILKADSFSSDDWNFRKLVVFIRIHLADESLLDLILRDETDLGFLTVPTEEVWNFLIARLNILAQTAEKRGCDFEKHCGKRTLTHREATVQQFIENEKNLLFSLVEIAEFYLEKLQDGRSAEDQEKLQDGRTTEDQEKLQDGRTTEDQEKLQDGPTAGDCKEKLQKSLLLLRGLDNVEDVWQEFCNSYHKSN